MHLNGRFFGLLLRSVLIFNVNVSVKVAHEIIALFQLTFEILIQTVNLI